MYSPHQCEILRCVKCAHSDHANEVSFSSCCHVYPGDAVTALFALVCLTLQTPCLVAPVNYNIIHQSLNHANMFTPITPC